MSLTLIPATWQSACLLVLALSMLIAVDVDLSEQRIPNILVGLLLCTGLVLNVIGPANGRGGLFSDFPGALGAASSLLGAVTGFALFIPLYWMRAMGAGDVKLMAALGSFAGPADTLGLGLCILVAGGVLAIVRMLWVKKTSLVLSNVMTMLGSLAGGSGTSFDPVTQSADRMPYALAFAGGLLTYGYWRLSGGPPLIRF